MYWIIKAGEHLHTMRTPQDVYVMLNSCEEAKKGFIIKRFNK